MDSFGEDDNNSYKNNKGNYRGGYNNNRNNNSPPSPGRRAYRETRFPKVEVKAFLSVAPSVRGVLIGEKWRTKEAIEDLTGVRLQIPAKNERGDIVLSGDEASVLQGIALVVDCVTRQKMFSPPCTLWFRHGNLTIRGRAKSSRQGESLFVPNKGSKESRNVQYYCYVFIIEKGLSEDDLQQICENSQVCLWKKEGEEYEDFMSSIGIDSTTSINDFRSYKIGPFDRLFVTSFKQENITRAHDIIMEIQRNPETRIPIDKDEDETRGSEIFNSYTVKPISSYSKLNTTTLEFPATLRKFEEPELPLELNRMKLLLDMQNDDGSFDFSPRIASISEVKFWDFNKEVVQNSNGEDLSIWATCLVVAYLECKWQAKSVHWMDSVQSARMWLQAFPQSDETLENIKLTFYGIEIKDFDGYNLENTLIALNKSTKETDFDFVSFRSNFIKILKTPCQPSEPWKCQVYRIKNHIFLNEINLAEGAPFPTSTTANLYESLSTDINSPDFSARVLVKGKFGDFKIILNSDIDCTTKKEVENFVTYDNENFEGLLKSEMKYRIKKNENEIDLKSIIELKTITYSDDNAAFKGWFLLQTWGQSFLGGVPTVSVSTTEKNKTGDKKTVRSSECYKTCDLPPLADGWSHEICLGFAERVLIFLKENIKENILYSLAFEAPSQNVTLYRDEDGKNFMPFWYTSLFDE